MPKECMPKERKARLIQCEASVAVAHSTGYGASVQDALSGAMAMRSALVRDAMLQGGTGVAMQTGSATEKITNSALSLMFLDFADASVKKLKSL